MIINEMDAESTQSARLLLRPEQKLLAGPVATATTVDNPAEISKQGEPPKSGTTNSLSEDEIAQLQQLLHKAKGGQAQPPRDEPKTTKRPRRKDA